MIACNREYSSTHEGELKPSIVRVSAHAEDFVSGGNPNFLLFQKPSVFKSLQKC